jgi:hypothetical protein
MKRSIAGARIELGRVLKQHPSRSRGNSVHTNLYGQQASTRLNDGHACSDSPARRCRRDETRQLENAASASVMAMGASNGPSPNTLRVNGVRSNE